MVHEREGGGAGGWDAMGRRGGVFSSFNTCGGREGEGLLLSPAGGEKNKGEKKKKKKKHGAEE